MNLKALDGKDKRELSMVEVAHAILSQHGDVLSFADLTNEIQKYLGDSDEVIRQRLAQFYTDLNTDGSFISLGDNLWGLRTWYPYDSIDEATVRPEDEDEERPKKKRRKVNAFLADASDDDDVIDYDNDDPEDDEFEDPADDDFDNIDGDTDLDSSTDLPHHLHKVDTDDEENDN